MILRPLIQRDLAQALAAYGRMAAYTGIVGQGEMPPQALNSPSAWVNLPLDDVGLTAPDIHGATPAFRSGSPVADAGARLPAGPVTFVLGESGHIAGVVNPPAARKYGYRTQAELPATPEAWLETATRHPGSWWQHWLDWLQPYVGPQVSARVPGDGGLQPLEEAPGSYVKVAGIE